MQSIIEQHKDLIVALGLPLYLTLWTSVMLALSVQAAKVPYVGTFLANLLHALALRPAPRSMKELAKDIEDAS